MLLSVEEFTSDGFGTKSWLLAEMRSLDQEKLGRNSMGVRGQLKTTETGPKMRQEQASWRR